MRVPFPNVDSGLAVKPHMYVCMKDGTQKEFIKCQSFRPRHLTKKGPPFHFLIESPDEKRNPFSNKTIIDCDKSFGVDNVIVDKSLITQIRKDVCEDLFQRIILKTNHTSFVKKFIDLSPLLSLNTKLKRGVSD